MRTELNMDLKRFIKNIAVLTLVLAGISSGETGRGGYAGSFLRMGLGARALASGGGSAVFFGDGSVAYYNPAGIVFVSTRRATASLASLSLDRSISFVGYAQSLAPNGVRNAGFGIGWIGAGINNIDGRDTNGEHTDTYSASENCFYFSFAHSITPRIAFGITAKILSYNFPNLSDDGTVSAKGLGFDFGIMAVPLPNLFAGIVIKDINSRYSWNTQSIWEKGTQKTDKFPLSVNAGAGMSLYNNLITVYLNYEKINYMSGTVSFGTELFPADKFALRAGLYRSNITFGAGFYWNVDKFNAGIDYAFVSDPVGPDNQHVVSVTFMF